MQDVDAGTVSVYEFLKVLAVEFVVGLARENCDNDLFFERQIVTQLIETGLE